MECSTNTVDRLIEAGELTPQRRKGRRGTLEQGEVLAAGQRRREKRDARTRARQENERRRMQPPDEEHQWLTAAQAARIAGLSPMGVYKRVQRGTIPFTDYYMGRHWFRRDLIELVSNARAHPPEPQPVRNWQQGSWQLLRYPTPLTGATAA